MNAGFALVPCSAVIAAAMAACSPTPAPPATVAGAAVAASTAMPASSVVARVRADEQECTDEPRAHERDRRPRCEGPGGAKPAAPRAYRVVGGSGDPVDQVVCDIAHAFVLEGKLFGVELSGGVDGSYRFVRTPHIPGLSWRAGGRYHIEFPDGEDLPGTLVTDGGGTTTAGALSRDTTGSEQFSMTPVPACE